MGRAKLNMELIRKEKSRHITFKKRKDGLMRKIHEFTTLCDVSTCIIIYGPKHEKCSSSEPAEVWPANPDEVSRIIETYKGKSKDSGTKVYGLSDFYNDRKKKIEDELEKVVKKNMERTYPGWNESMSFLAEPQLRDFAATLGNKHDFFKAKVESIKGINDHYSMQQNRFLMLDAPLPLPLPPPQQQQQQQPPMIEYNNINNSTRSLPPPGLIQRGIEWEYMNQQAAVNPIEMHGPTIHYHANIDQEMHSVVNPNSMMGLLMNENDHHHHPQMQYVGAANIQCASFKREIYYGGGGGGGGGVIENGVYGGHPRPLSLYQAPTMQAPNGTYMQFPTTSNVPLPLPLATNLQQNEYNDLFHYQMKDPHQKPRH